MSEQNKKLTNRLIEASLKLEGSLRIFQEINDKAHFIALSAAIEGARMKGLLGTFSIVANQIAQQASKNSELSEKLKSLVQKIENQALEAVAVRNLELAVDLIDKLDRNLFERNCDVQAWASFDLVQNALINPDDSAFQAASELLQKLVKTYVVYSDSFLFDREGNLVSSANHPDLMGTNLGEIAWFKSALAGNVTVTDVHYNNLVNSHTVMYCAPVFSPDQQIIGVLANCFDWAYALEMIESGEYGPTTKAVIIDNQANVIASKKKSQIMKDSYDWMRAGEHATEQGVGYSIEHARNGEPLASGFCFTKGYNAYRGKGWSAVVMESLDEVNIKVQSKVTEDRSQPAVAVVPGVPKEIESERSGQNLLATMKEIDDLVLEINYNNREVKLLAVNAAIQAGLAGAEGEGFAVIANEVANLAKKSLSFVEFVNESTSNLRQAVDHSSSIRLVDAARDTMSKIDRNLFERYCDIQAWSTFTLFQTLLQSGEKAGQDSLALLQKIHKIYEVYHDIYILDRNGMLVASAINHALIGRDFSSREWFRSALEGRTYFSDIQMSETLRMPTISFSAPIVGPNKEVLGVIASRFNCNFLDDIIRAAIVDSKTKPYLLNQQGLVIASSDSTEVYKKEFTHLEEVKQFRSGVSGLIEEKGTGYSFSKGYNTYSGQKWVVVTERPKSSLQQTTNLTPSERFKQKMKIAG